MSSRWKTGIAALLAAGTVFGASAVSDVANALPPLAPPFQPGGGVTLSPSNGGFSTPFNFSFNPVNQACPGDNTQGWFFSPYLTADDPAPLTFSAAGSPLSAAGGRTTALRDTGGNLIRNVFPNLVDGNLISIPDLSFQQSFASTPLVPGVYNVGMACFNANAVTVAGQSFGVRENARYWNTQITASSSVGSTTVADTFAVGVQHVKPILSAGTGTATTQNIAIDNPQSGLSSYTLNVTPAPGGALPTVAPNATSFQLTGLTLGTSYTVELTVVKTGFTNQTSDPLSFTASTSCPVPSVTALDVFLGDDVTVNWSAPAPCPATPASYDVEIFDGATSVASLPGVTLTTATFPGLAIADYTARVTPNYAGGSGVITVAPGYGEALVSVNDTVAGLITQELTVTRPKGALILTQRCGVFNDLEAFDAVPDFPGFPFDLGAEDATLDQVGTAPTGATPGEFNDYPLPNQDPLGLAEPFSNETNCGLSMGVARFVTEFNIDGGTPSADNALVGNFFAANGRLNEVTVLDTRDLDIGWELRGDIEDRFTQANGDTFSGNYLGWEPVMTDDSDVVGGEGFDVGGAGPLYDQTVLPGPTVLPGDGFDPILNPTATLGAIGLTDNPLLASAADDAGLGISTHDARLLMLIPASRDAGLYSATLTLTVG